MTEFKTVWTLNTILSSRPIEKTTYQPEIELKKEIDDFLRRGFAVRVGASCMGHTLAWMVESAGAQYIKENYNVTKAKDDWGDVYYCLSQED